MLPLETGCFSEHFYISGTFVKSLYIKAKSSTCISQGRSQDLAGRAKNYFFEVWQSHALC